MTLSHAEIVDAYRIDDRAARLVRMNFVSSIDGAATVRGRSAALGGETDRAIMQVLRAMCDVVLVGAGTVRVEGYGGTKVEGADAAWRRDRDLPPQPRLAVVSRRLDLDPGHGFFAEAVTRPLVVTCADAPGEAREALSRVADVIVAGEASVDLSVALAALADLGLRHVLSEGGPHLFGSLFTAGLVDEMCLTLSPRLVGGDAGRIMRGAPEGPRNMRLHHAVEDDGWLFLRYVAESKESS